MRTEARGEVCAPARHLPRTGRAPAAACLALCLMAGAAMPAMARPTRPATSQKVKATTRLVEGTIEDKSGKPLGGAVVYLRDEKTSVIKTYLADDSGHFRFGQLSLSTDYKLWARMNGKRSKTKFISMFNSKPTLDFKLKISKAE